MKTALLSLANLDRTTTTARTSRRSVGQLALACLLVGLASCGGGGGGGGSDAPTAPPANPGTGNGGGGSGGGNTGGGNTGGGSAAIDPRLIGRWENQEILQSNTPPVSFSVINVDRLTFAADLSGSVDEFSIVNGAPGQITSSVFTWTPIAPGAIRVTEQGFAPADVQFAFTTDGSAMQLGGRVFNRLN